MRYGGKRQAKIRPEYFRLDATHSLARGLSFAGLQYMGSLKSASYHDSCAELRGSGAANHGTLTNMDPPSDHVWVPELGRWATDYDGVNDYVSGTNNTDLDATNISISAWVKFNSLAAGMENPRLIELRDADYSVQIIRDDSTSSFATKHSKWETAIDGLYWNSPSTGVLYHVAAVWNTTAQTTAFCVNGISQISTAFSNIGAGNQNNRFYMGARSDLWGGTFLSGLLADALIWSRVLTPSEIKTLADRSDPMLGGLILPPRRRLWGAVSVTNRRRRILLGAAA